MTNKLFDTVVIGILVGVLSIAAGVLAAEEPVAIKHRFLAMDESRHAAVFVDEHDPSKNWRLEFPAPAELGFHFFGGFQVLANGHIVQCNWTGHGAQDSAKGVQIVEFDAAGRIVWQWHHPELAGSIHGVLVLDDLESSEFGQKGE